MSDYQIPASYRGQRWRIVPAETVIAADDAPTLTMRSGSGPPSGAPSATELPIGIDTLTGFVYLWNGSVWVELVTTS